MTTLANLPSGKLIVLLGELSDAGLTIELAEKLSREPDLACKVVALIKIYSAPSGWSPVQCVTLTDQWQNVAPTVQAVPTPLN